MNLRDNLTFLIDRARLNANALAAATGVPQSTIHRIQTGESRDPRTSTLKPLADFFGVTVTDLREADLPRRMSPAGATPNVLVKPDGSRRVPLLRYDDAQNVMSETTLDSLASAESLLTDQSLSPRAFAVELVNESMSPDFRPGDRVICDPAITPAPGDFVLARMNGAVHFGKYRPRQDGSFELHALNPDYPTLTLSADAVIATMAEHRRYRRR